MTRIVLMVLFCAAVLLVVSVLVVYPHVKRYTAIYRTRPAEPQPMWQSVRKEPSSHAKFRILMEEREKALRQADTAYENGDVQGYKIYETRASKLYEDAMEILKS